MDVLKSLSVSLFLTWILLSTPTESASTAKVLMVSMDGFRWDYLDGVDTPNFDAFAKEGVKLPYMNNSFATKTFPNHYSMVTGLYEESHGIVENHMYDPVFNARFSPKTKDPRWWSEGEPMWITATRQGVKSGAYFWVGSETRIRGHRPDYWMPYKEETPFRHRVDVVVDWFKTKNVQLVNLYFHEPDATGHKHGPDSPEIRSKVKDMDNLLGYLMQKLVDNGINKEVNVIVTSDHGMTSVDHAKRVVFISDHVDMSKVKMVPSKGPLLHLLPVIGQEDAVVKSLTGVPHITVYRKEIMPEHFHYKNNRRIMPIVVIADDEWLVTANTDKLRESQIHEKGTHGFDNRLQNMKPIFMARGPFFKKNYIGSVIQNVDIYPLVCRILDITPAPNNGSLDRVKELLADEHFIIG